MNLEKLKALKPKTITTYIHTYISLLTRLTFVCFSHLEGNKLEVLPQRVFQSQTELRRM